MQVILITGGAGGLGLALAKEALQRGMGLALVDVNQRGLRSAQKELDAFCLTLPGKQKEEGKAPLLARQSPLKKAPIPSSQNQILVLHADITKSRDCQRVVQKTLKYFGKLDVLVNNAGISHRSLFSDTQTGLIRKIMEVNYFGSVEMTKAALPALLQSKGSIIAISSVAGFAPLLGRTGYVASKHALRGFFETLRSELKDKVHILLVYPSFIRTGLVANAKDGRGRSLGARKRKGVGKDISPEKSAFLILHALSQKKRSLYFPWVSRLSDLLMRLYPALYVRLMERNIQEEFSDS